MLSAGAHDWAKILFWCSRVVLSPVQTLSLSWHACCKRFSYRATPSLDTTAAGFSNRDPLAMREPAALVCRKSLARFLISITHCFN
jgi:hypothetical protein